MESIMNNINSLELENWNKYIRILMMHILEYSHFTVISKIFFKKTSLIKLIWHINPRCNFMINLKTE